jgi:dihydroxy-acid dehydratase
VAPEAADGGPLAIVRTGDMIELDVPARRLDLKISVAEFDRRMAALPPVDTSAGKRGYERLYHERVMQADDGVDFDFLRGDVLHSAE